MPSHILAFSQPMGQVSQGGRSHSQALATHIGPPPTLMGLSGTAGPCTYSAQQVLAFPVAGSHKVLIMCQTLV